MKKKLKNKEKTLEKYIARKASMLGRVKKVGYNISKIACIVTLKVICLLYLKIYFK